MRCLPQKLFLKLLILFSHPALCLGIRAPLPAPPAPEVPRRCQPRRDRCERLSGRGPGREIRIKFILKSMKHIRETERN